jgi:hypothetical protein
MPLYRIEHKLTGEERDELFSWEELQAFLADNPDWQQGVPDKMNIGYRPGSQFKVDDEFNSLLKKIKKENPGGQVNTK